MPPKKNRGGKGGKGGKGGDAAPTPAEAAAPAQAPVRSPPPVQPSPSPSPTVQAGVSSSSSVSSLASKASSMQISTKKKQASLRPLATRPKNKFGKFGGTIGRNVSIVTNYFRLKVLKPFTVYQHDVTISCRMKGTENERKAIKAKDEMKEIWRLFVKQNRELGNGIYDNGKIFYSVSGAITINDALIHEHYDYSLVVVPADAEPFTVDGTMTPLSSAFLNTALIYKLTEGNDEVVKGSNFFRLCTRVESIETDRGSRSFGGNLAMLDGCYKSVRMCEIGPCINTDFASVLIMLGGSLPKVIGKILVSNRSHQQFLDRNSGLPCRPLGEAQIDYLQRELRGMKVKQMVGIVGRKMKIMELSAQPASQITFTIDENGRKTQTTVVQYFKKRYGVDLKYPFLPCITTTKRNPQTNQTAKSYMPLEIFNLVDNQVYDKKLSPDLQNLFTRHTIIPPHERFQKTTEAVRRDLDMAVKKVAPSKIEMSIEPLTVQGRVLPKPTIGMADRMGKSEYQITRFETTNPMNQWCVITIIRGQPNNDFDASRWSQALVKTAKESFKWDTFAQPLGLSELHIHPADNANQITTKITAKFEEVLKRNVGFIICAIPDTSTHEYGAIKTICNEKQIKNQNIKLDRMGMKKLAGPAYLKNLLLKINYKNGGTNASLATSTSDASIKVPPVLSSAPLLIGMDVYHPGVGEKEKPSIVGFVGSYDLKGLKYRPIARVQPRTGTEEVTDEVDYAVDQFINTYKNSTRQDPKTVIFFRDGVSEGQFQKVRDYEVEQVVACLSKYNPRPKLTFVTVQKRHKFRMYTRDSGNRINNPVSGTVVDKDIVNPEFWQFYLNSHTAIKGTSKPANVTIIFDENGFTDDDIQMIAFCSSWTSARCTKPISVPVPANYAHLVAERANLLFETQRRSIEHSQEIEDLLRYHRNNPREVMTAEKRAFLNGLIEFRPSPMAFA